jgi:CRISPR-associated protein Csx16
MTRLVTFLGLGKPADEEPTHYVPSRYRLGAVETGPTPLHDVATVLAAASGPVHVRVLGTAEVRARWFGEERRYEQFLAEGLAGAREDVRVSFGLLPDGRSTAELWEIFETVRGALSPEPLAEEPGTPAEILVDITHGFRSQSFFAAAALAFARSSARRQGGVRDSPPLRILYAAFEARTKPKGEEQPDPVVPVWDLTPFLDAVEWDRAVDALMRYGRGDDLQRLFVAAQRRAMMDGGRGAVPPQLQRFGRQAATFADALATARLPQLISERGAALARAVDEARADVERHAPPVAPSLDELARWARSIAGGQAVSIDGVERSLALGAIYERLERFLELACLLRETLVSAWSLRRRPPEAVLQPDARGFGEERRRDEGDLNAAPADDPLVQAFRRVGQLRNDLQHGGFREGAAKADGLRRNLSQALGDVRALLAAPGFLTCVGDAARTPSFVNCSNHPSAEWTDEQRRAALALVGGSVGDIVDLEGGFPAVPPETDEAAVQELADETATRIARLVPAAAFVAGEWTLAYAVLTRLRRHGIRCVAATSERRTEELRRPDGTVLRHSTWRFVRWRDYE